MGDSIWAGVKTVLAVVLLPLALASLYSFHAHLSTYSSTFQSQFFLGAATFLFLFLFCYQFWGIYEGGQKVVEGALRFMAPMERLVAHLLPFYLISAWVALFVLRNFLDLTRYNNIFVFVAGFTATMHTVLTARDLQEQEKSLLKSTYLFVMTLVFIVMGVYLVGFLDVAGGPSTLMVYVKVLIQKATDIYVMILDRMLFFN